MPFFHNVATHNIGMWFDLFQFVWTQWHAFFVVIQKLLLGLDRSRVTRYGLLQHMKTDVNCFFSCRFPAKTFLPYLNYKMLIIIIIISVLWNWKSNFIHKTTLHKWDKQEIYPQILKGIGFTQQHALSVLKSANNSNKRKVEKLKRSENENKFKTKVNKFKHN